jgi:hypothetical protein
MNSGAGLRIILVWCLAILAAVAWWFNRNEQGVADRVRETYPLGDSIPLDRLTEVEIIHADGRVFRMISTPAGWQQTEPFPVEIDTFSVRELGSTAQGLVRVDSIDISDAESAGRLGLDPAAATITWTWQDGESSRSQSVELGNRTLAGRAWVRLDEEPDRAALVDADLHVKVLESDMRYLRNRMLAPNAGIETQQVVVEAGNERMELRRTDSGWQLLEPVRTRGDDAAIADWLARIARARSSGFLHDQPESLDRFGLAEPVGVLALRTGSGGVTGEDGFTGGSRVILLGDPIGVGSADRYGLIEGSPTVIRLDGETQQVLVPTAATLVDATGSGVIREDIAGIEIQTADEALSIERDFDGWQAYLGQDDPVEIARDPVEQLMKQLTSSRAGEILLTPFPLELQHAIVILYGFDGSPIDTIRIARDPDGGNWALENGDDVLRIFPASFELPLRAVDFGLPDSR